MKRSWSTNLPVLHKVDARAAGENFPVTSLLAPRAASLGG